MADVDRPNSCDRQLAHEPRMHSEDPFRLFRLKDSRAAHVSLNAEAGERWLLAVVQPGPEVLAVIRLAFGGADMNNRVIRH